MIKKPLGPCPDREILVFDRRVAARPDCIPDDTHMIVGDIVQTLQSAEERIGGKAALAHCDIGTGEKKKNPQKKTPLIII